MTSKSAKLRSHRIKQGRPRKQDVPRHPCGQINKSYARAETEREVKSIVMEARARVHLLKAAPNMVEVYGGYTAGRMYLDGNISEEQLKAGNEYAQVAYRYCLATGIPFPSARAQELGRVTGHSGEESDTAQRRATRAANDMMRLIGILQACQEGPRVKQTIHNLFVMDEEALRLMPEQQMLWLRRGLNELIYQEGLRRNANQITVS